MKEYGPLGHGASFSLSSNLSPLAPPFTVDPTFLGSVHDLPLGNRPENRHEPYFEDDPHYAFPARPSHDNWLQLNSHAYEPGLFPNPNPGPVTSSPTSKTSVDPATAYGQSLNNFFGSPSESWPYHPQYPPASFDGCNTSFDVNGRGNVLPATVFPSTAPSSVFWNAKSDSETWKEKGKDVNVAAPSYASIVNRGISSTDGLSARPEPPQVWFGKPVESLAVKGFFGSREINLPNGKLSSTSEENSKDIPYDTSKMSSASFKEKPYNLTPPPDFAMESWTQLTPSIPSYGRYFTGGDSYKGDPLCFYPVSSNPSFDQIYGSSSKSLSTCTSPIELPRDARQRKDGFTRDNPSGMGCTPVMDEISECYGGADSINNGVAEYVERHAIGGKSTMLTSRSVSTSTSPIERPRDAWQRKEVYAGFSPSNSRCTPVMVDISECYGGKRSINIGAEEYVDPLMSEDVPLLRNPPPSTGPLRHLFKAENKVQVPDFGLPGTLPTAATGVSDSVECSSEVLEQFNPCVDSPCWKGASDSRYSLFGASDAGTADMPAKILESTRSIQGPQELPVHFDKAVAFPTELQRNEKCYREERSSSLLEQAFPVATLPSLEHHSNLPKIGPDRSQFSNTNVIHFPFPGNTGGGSDVESLRTNMSCYDECTVASRQAGKIADPGIGNLTEPNLQPSTSTKFPIGDVGKVVNMMQNLSELFLSYCDTDGVALEEQDHVVIEQVIQNLETSLNRVGTTRSSPKTQLPQCEMSKCSEKPTDAHKDTAAGGSQATNYSLVTQAGMFQTTCTEVKDVGSRQYIQNACKGNNSSNMDDSRPLSFPNGDSEMEQDEMTKAIKIILEENFSDEEEQEPQNMLYKNLWLEAEAALCSISYKARFARMKGEMKKYKQHQTKGELIDVEKLPSLSGPIEIKGSVNWVEPKSRESGDREVANVLMQDHNKSTAASHLENIVDSRSKEIEDGRVANVLLQDHNESTSARIPEDTVESKSKETEDGEVATFLIPGQSESSTESHTENLEASVMARFHILKSRINSKVPINTDGQQDDSDSGSLHAGTQEAASSPVNMQCSEDIVMKPQPPKLVNPNFSAPRNPLHFMSENSEVDLHYMDHYSSRYPSPFIKLCSQPNITPQMDHFSVKHAEEKPGYHELHDLLEFSAMQSANTNSSVDQYCAGDYDSQSPSSDWEHVLKEATWSA